jgi:hypothetical protein
MARARPAFTCPCCGAVSRHPKDVEQKYCGRCHWWTGDPELGPAHLDEPCPHRTPPPWWRRLWDHLNDGDQDEIDAGTPLI